MFKGYTDETELPDAHFYIARRTKLSELFCPSLFLSYLCRKISLNKLKTY